MQKSKQALEVMFNGGLSKRYHTVDTIKEQNIAAHSFGVAILCELLSQGEASKRLIMHALTHDLAEFEIGDVPSPSKRAMNISEKLDELERSVLHKAGYIYDAHLTEDEHRIFKLADYMDGMNFCVREKMLGNRTIDVVFWRFHEYTIGMIRSDQERLILNAIEQEWGKYVS